MVLRQRRSEWAYHTLWLGSLQRNIEIGQNELNAAET